MTVNMLVSSLGAVCPTAPPGAQAQVDALQGYVMWGVIALFGISAFVGIGAVAAGRLFSMPHASKAGVVSLVVVFFAAVAYLVVPPMVTGVTGSGCV